LGTPYDLNYDNKLVFLEDVSEKPYRIDRMLTQMLMAGKFKKAKGIILGVFAGCETEDSSHSLTLSEVLNDRFSQFPIPVIYGMSFGHIANQFTLPYGIRARLDTESQTVTLLESAVL
jgi:muramoyltetrapeptide carboxypeptidase